MKLSHAAYLYKHQSINQSINQSHRHSEELLSQGLKFFVLFCFFFLIVFLGRAWTFRAISASVAVFAVIIQLSQLSPKLSEVRASQALYIYFSIIGVNMVTTRDTKSGLDSKYS
jgi:hypothetical protein